MNCTTCNQPAEPHELPGGKCARCWYQRNCELESQLQREHNRYCDGIARAAKCCMIMATKLNAAVKAARRWKDRARCWQATTEKYFKAIQLLGTSECNLDELCRVRTMQRDYSVKAARRWKKMAQRSAWNELALEHAVNESCECGGKGPNDGCCPACEVWHRVQGRL